MPIWLELMVLMLLAYAIGLGFGWLLWGRDTGAKRQGKDG